MDIQKSYSRDVSYNYSYPVTENFEYSSITSAFESLLSIDQIYRAVMSTEAHSIKLTFKVKKLASAFKSSQDPFTSFFTYLPPALKQDLSPLQVVSTFVQDFSTEVPDFPISICIVPVSKLLSHTGRPQEIFEKEMSEGKPKIVAFEFNWDIDLTMENVAKVIKSIPGNIQSQGFLEIASLIMCSGSYYSSVCKVQENWKCCDKFMDKEPISWVKIAWMMVSGLKYPNMVVYQRVEGYKSTANFITSLDFENLIKFTRKQDQKAKLIPKNTEGLSFQELKSQEKNVATAKFGRAQVETKELYARPDSRFNYGKDDAYSLNPESRVQISDNILEDPGRKSTTPLMRKYEYTENKPSSLDARVQALSEKYSYKPNTRFDIPKAPYRKDELLDIDKYASPKNKEDSFRSLDRNEEMERIHLGTPKDRVAPPTRSFSRQEESYSKISFTPQRNMGEKIVNYTPKDQDEKAEASPYFREKFNFREKYSDLLKDKPSSTLEERNFGEGKKFREDFSDDYKGYKDERFAYRDMELKDDRGEGINREDLEYKSRDPYQRDSLNGLKGYDLGKRDLPPRSELPPRGSYKSSLEAVNRDDLLGRNYKPKLAPTEEDQGRKPLSSYEELTEKYKFLDAKEQKPKEGTYSSGQYKAEDFKSRGFAEDSPKGEGLKFKDPYQENDRPKFRDYRTQEFDTYKQQKNYSLDSQDLEESKKKDSLLEILDRNKYRDYKYPEGHDYKSELKAHELPQDDEEAYSNSENEEKPQVKNLRDNESNLYEKYRPSYPSKEDNFESDFKRPNENYTPQGTGTKLEEFRKKNREFYKPSEEKLYDYPGVKEDSFSKYKQFSTKDEKPNYNLRTLEANEEAPRRIIKPQEPDALPSVALVETSKPQETLELADWNCGKCGKAVKGSAYECGECRLINWDQFYKVKSQQHTRNKTEENSYKPAGNTDGLLKEDQGRRMYSFSDKKDDEESDWICSICKSSNKNLFFLCKSCRKPRTQAPEGGVEGRKEKITS
ncbi:hypothetical protein SteCoe_3676 [Stentor coeruleus]|uniref:RanBP2-type domain-containing protein n=1 Tax=Stentor coeruleus TaxID=5963 RepID=A0A1R2CWE4_9CILI|nr:hypothetical protein SteCoe_3676 [Stentor coeruleus]